MGKLEGMNDGGEVDKVSLEQFQESHPPTENREAYLKDLVDKLKEYHKSEATLREEDEVVKEMRQRYQLVFKKSEKPKQQDKVGVN